MLQQCCTSEITKGARHKGKVPAVGRQQEYKQNENHKGVLESLQDLA